MGSKGFRYDINALRAAAVAGVVLYHFRVAGFGGGFVGVDVFFVISGFLMTGIIDRGLAAGRLDIPRFYAARVRRIIPALAVMLLALLAVAALALDPLTTQKIGRNAVSSALFLSNIDYFLTQDYFAEPAESNWLLHTWSLSLEWQFYLLYPIVFAILSRFSLPRRVVQAILIVAAAASLAIALAVAQWGEGAIARSSFYLLPARAWEMLAGGIVAMASTNRLSEVQRRLVAAAGFAIILVSFVGLRANSTWPSAFAIIPVVATALVLWAGAAEGPITRAWPVRQIGLWSYSIYLWHWPIVVGGRYFGFYDDAPSVMAGVLASIVAGAASYYLVERGLADMLFRRGLSRGVAVVLTVAASAAGAAAVIVGTAGFHALRTRSMAPEVRVALDQLKGVAAAKRPELACQESPIYPAGLVGCVVGKGQKTTLILGDSHAAQLIIRYAGDGRLDRRILSLTKNGCALLPEAERVEGGQGCLPATNAALAEAASGKYDRIVVLSSWRATLDRMTLGRRGRVCFIEGRECVLPKNDAAYRAAADHSFELLGRRLGEAREKGSQVFIITALPAEATADPATMYRRTFLTRSVDHPATPKPVWFTQEAVSREGIFQAARRGGLTVVDAADRLCGAESCAFADASGPHQYDTGHYRAEYLRTDAFDFLDAAIAPHENR